MYSMIFMNTQTYNSTVRVERYCYGALNQQSISFEFVLKPYQI